jgi:hypothetical protein
MHIDGIVQLDDDRVKACRDKLNASSNSPVSLEDVLDAALIALTTLQASGVEFTRGRRFAALRRTGDRVVFYSLDGDGVLVEHGEASWTGAR